MSRSGRGRGCGRIHCDASRDAEQSVLTETKTSTKVRAVLTVKPKAGGAFAHLDQAGIWGTISDMWDDLRDRTMRLELVSSELDPNTGKEKTVEGFARDGRQEGGVVTYAATFKLPKGFGEIGGVLVRNEHHEEMYLEKIVLMTDDDTPPVTVDCRSWLASESDSKEKRIFFTTKCYLPNETPAGLVNLRQKELENLRGNGKGERKKFERIYDYDVYNDLGNPDKNKDLKRPVLGGTKDLPYPRRCRTGRKKTNTDSLSERPGDEYVPRDEAFSEVKDASFKVKTARSVLHSLIPQLEAIIDKSASFPDFKDIAQLYDEGVVIPKQEGFSSIFPRIIKAVENLKEGAEELLLFEPPALINKDSFSWFRDEEFARQTLAGLNPLSIQLVTEFPFVSKLDPKIYGPPESAITEDIINEQIRGVMSAREALEQKRLFLLDYHDLYLPYVYKVRELEDVTLYGSRTLFFLTNEGTLRPLAIELTRPASPTKPQWKRVYKHSWNATESWLWKLAKAHVLSHDSGYHQLVSHWLRTHCCAEPYVIAMNRQLSAMHPIYRLMHPHFRYTMEINALARQMLINAGGVIESNFAPGKYSVELSSVAYREQWRFDMEALPADLIRRGMAVEDPAAEHGLRLTIEDYPYANDGLLVWSSIKEWVSDYVNHYYPSPVQIKDDQELQNWWTDVRTKGHADKKDEPWWPTLNTQDDLIQVLTTIIWVNSGHHAAVNFGQYPYAGYFPNRPTTARKNMPSEEEGSEAFFRFWAKPEQALLECFPSQIQATSVMAILDVLSTHSPDEEYLGGEAEPAWASDKVINAAFERFSGRLKEIEGIIDARNINTKLQNRCGAGMVPYELLKPFSEAGVTGKGVPNSISI